ncbi:hypothetical protein GCM10009725_25740 [Aeromicrobium tamlense]
MAVLPAIAGPVRAEAASAADTASGFHEIFTIYLSWCPSPRTHTPCPDGTVAGHRESLNPLAPRQGNAPESYNSTTSPDRTSV